MKREDIENAKMQPLYVSIYPGLVAGQPIKSTTGYTYQLTDFLSSALAEGAVDCAP